MKLNHIFSGVALLSLCLSACSDQMDYKEFKIDGDDYVKRDFDKVGKITTHIYRALDYDFGQMYGGASLCSATDEAVYSHEGNAIESYYNGAWSATNANDRIWGSSLEAIQYCNLYLDNYTELEFPEHKLEKDYKDQMLKYHNYQWEVRYMRAYFYFNLLRQYGSLPLMTRYMNAEEANNAPLATTDEIFEFIDNECEAIKDSIVKNYNGAFNSIENEPGRVNNLGVLALRARAALYHASPLFSKGKSDSEKKELWHKAALRNKECIDTCRKQGLSLAAKYESLFANNNYQAPDAQKEIIFGTRTAKSNNFEKYNFPVSVLGAGGGNCPTENLVSAYEMKNGKAITDETSGYDPQDPYKNRDARLAVTVAVNGEKWPTTLPKDALETYVGGADSRTVSYGTPTGYYLKKYVNGETKISGTGVTSLEHVWIVYRMGQVYLDYAEAMLNYMGDGYKAGEVADDNLNMTAAEAINMVRKRAGQPDLPTGLNFEDFTARYENERFVELAFEGHRMFDMRRWMKADKYFTNIKVMEITKNADDTFTFTPKENPSYITARKWNDRNYFWPIPQSEVLKSGTLVQNEGW